MVQLQSLSAATGCEILVKVSWGIFGATSRINAGQCYPAVQARCNKLAADASAVRLLSAISAT